MKTFIVIIGENEVIYLGSWFGCLNQCKDRTGPLRIAVMRKGEHGGRVIAEMTNNILKHPIGKTFINAKSFK